MRLRRWLRRASFRTRLALLAAAAAGLAVALTAVASYFVVQRQLYSEVNNNLANQVTSALRVDPDSGTATLVLSSLDRAGRNGDAVQVVTASGQPIYAAVNGQQAGPGEQVLPVLPVQPADRALAAPGAAGDRRFSTVTFQGAHYRVFTLGVGGPQVFQGVSYNGLALQVAQNLTLVYGTLEHLRLVLGLLALVGIGVALALGLVVARAMIRPVERLTAAAEHVAATQDLERTIDEEGDDELARLARSFNAMLAALAGSRQAQAQLVSDAGHELRTPLTSLRTNMEVLMRIPDLPAADRAALLADVQAQLQELTTLVGDLVELAREDERDTAPVDVAFDGVVERALERARRRAGGVTFEVHTEPGMVRAQPALLERAVLNVLDNAAKWSPPGGLVEVRLRRRATWELDVRDHGPGIAEEDLPRVFDRFYRAERARAMPGSGLGLAIVRQVVTASGGRVSASTPPDGGTLIHMELPIVAEEEAPPPAWPDAAGPLAPVPAWPDG